MDLTFKFRDNENSIKLNIDKNSVLFGFNGTGKTRVLKLLKDLSDEKRNKNRLIDLFEQFNVENIHIEGGSFLELLSDKGKKVNSVYNEFIEKNKPAFLDFSMISKDIVKNNKSIPFFPTNRFRMLEKVIKYLLERNSNSDKGRYLTQFLKESESLIHEVKTSFEIGNFHNRDIISQIWQAERIISFLNRRFADFKFDNEDYNHRREEFFVVYKNLLFSKLNRTVKYISPDFDELEKIKEQVIQEFLGSKTLIANQYVSKLIKQMDGDKEESKEVNENKLRTILYNLKKVNEIIKNYTTITLKFEGNELLAKKDNDKLDLCQLSSGERRLLTLLLNCVYSSENLLLIDEPEVSLSLNYQSKIMNDLVEILGEKVVIIATHAPFVFKSCESMEFDLVEL